MGMNNFILATLIVCFTYLSMTQQLAFNLQSREDSDNDDDDVDEEEDRFRDAEFKLSLSVRI